jgi:hypothetical protein
MKKFTVEFLIEDDGRWIADIVKPKTMNGVMSYGETPQQALVRALAIAKELEQ